jgi:hypothetical protein
MEATMKRWTPGILFAVVLYFAMLACNLPSPSGAVEKVDSISTSAAGTVEKIRTDAVTLQAIRSEAAATVAAEMNAKEKTPVLLLPKGTLNRGLVPHIGSLQVAGSISGAIHQAGAVADAMRIYWREVNSGKVGYIETAKTDTTYKISGLASGDYNVISWYWPQGASGAVTTSNIINAQGAAQQHTCESSLRKIHLDAGQNVTGADIGCWGGNYFFLVTPAAP